MTLKGVLWTDMWESRHCENETCMLNFDLQPGRLHFK
jgi:hypothetical protein